MITIKIKLELRFNFKKIKRLVVPISCGTDDVSPIFGDESCPHPGSLEEVVPLFSLGGLFVAFGLMHQNPKR